MRGTSTSSTRSVSHEMHGATYEAGWLARPSIPSMLYIWPLGLLSSRAVHQAGTVWAQRYVLLPLSDQKVLEQGSVF